MTKQEIEKAIENGESVWFVDFDNKVKEVMLEKTAYIKEYYVYLTTNGKYQARLKFIINRVCKTKAEAEHYLHHANITRTETLPFLTWEEFLKEREIRFVDNIGEEWYLYYHYSDEFIYIYLQSKFGYHGEKTRNPQNLGELTEANFYKAYDECVRLFKGEIWIRKNY